MKKRYLFTGWFADYECPGGDCGLTCCSAEWKIQLTDEEIQKYRELEDERLNITDSIDCEKKQFICASGTCNLMNKDGYCEIVLKYGPQHLSKTCELFPRGGKVYEDIAERWVEIVCPLVSKRLFDKEPMDFVIQDSDEEVEVDNNKAEEYDILSASRLKMIDLFQLLPEQFIQGKIYILCKLINQMRNACACSDNMDTRNELRKLTEEIYNDNTLPEMLYQCESIKGSIREKVRVIRYTLIYLTTKTRTISLIMERIEKKFSGFRDVVNKWLNDEEELYSDVVSYVPYLRNEYPQLTENYFVYSTFIHWMLDGIEEFGNSINVKIVEYMLIQLWGMAYYKLNGYVDIKDYSVIISIIDRQIAHSRAIIKVIKEYVSQLKSDDIMSLLLLILV